MKLFDWCGIGAFLTCGLATVGHRFGFINFRIAFVIFVVAMLICGLVFIAGLIKLSSHMPENNLLLPVNFPDYRLRSDSCAGLFRCWYRCIKSTDDSRYNHGYDQSAGFCLYPARGWLQD